MGNVCCGTPHDEGQAPKGKLSQPVTVDSNKEIKDFLQKIKNTWDSEIDADQTKLRDAYLTDPVKKDEREARIQQMWTAAGDDSVGLTKDQFKVFANAHFDQEDSDCGGKHRLQDASLDLAYITAKSTCGEWGSGLKLAQFIDFVGQCTVAALKKAQIEDAATAAENHRLQLECVSCDEHKTKKLNDEKAKRDRIEKEKADAAAAVAAAEKAQIEADLKAANDALNLKHALSTKEKEEKEAAAAEKHRVGLDCACDEHEKQKLNDAEAERKRIAKEQADADEWDRAQAAVNAAAKAKKEEHDADIAYYLAIRQAEADKKKLLPAKDGCTMF